MTSRRRFPSTTGRPRRLAMALFIGLLLTGVFAAWFLPRGGIAKANAPEAPLVLGAASNFSQGWNDQTFEAALRLPVTRFRDGIRWSEVETSPGKYVFDKPRTAYIAELGKRGARLTLTLNWGNPLYDNGDTPHSPEALAAFEKFVTEMVSRYPAIDTIEVGNEFNGANFVSGLVKEAGLAKRGRYHLAMVRSAVQAVKAVRPEVKVLGGATHSLPGGYIWPLLDGGGAELFDGLAVHPYTTPIDQLAAQIGVLRRHPAARTMPLHVTEFGSRDADRAGDDLVRAYATMASLGVRELDWYPLNERGDGHIPLIGRDLAPTAAGEAFRFVQEQLADRVGKDVSPDRFTFLHAFGRNTWVAWGAARTVAIGAGVEAYDATGAHLPSSDLRLAEDRALILVGNRRLRSGGNVTFGCNPLVADSFYQFGYPEEGQTQADGDGFERFVAKGARELPLETLPGQQRSNVPWNPYLGLAAMPQLRLTADSMLPALTGNDAIVHRYTATSDLVANLNARFTPSAESADGISVTVSLNGDVIFERSGNSSIEVERALQLKAGDEVSLAVSANGTSRGDTTDYRIRLFDEAKCK